MIALFEDLLPPPTGCVLDLDGRRPGRRRLTEDLHLAQAVERISALRAHADVASGGLQAAGAAPPHTRTGRRVTHPKGGEGRAVVRELDDVIVVVVALQVDCGHASGGTEIVEDVTLGAGEYRSKITVPRVAFASHDAVGQALGVRDPGLGSGRFAGK